MFLLFSLLLSAGVYFLRLERRFVSYRPAVLTESPEEFRNPYAGWYHMYGYMLSDQTPLDLSQAEKQEPGPGLRIRSVMQAFRSWRICLPPGRPQESR